MAAALHEISGIGKSSLLLLDAAGIRDTAHLARQDAKKLTGELRKANEVLKIGKRPPSQPTVSKWIAAAGALVGVPESETAEPAVIGNPVNYEGSEEVAAMLAEAPFAIPLPGRVMMEKQLRVSDVPAGILLNRYSGDLDVRVEPPASWQCLQHARPARIEGDRPFPTSTGVPRG